jgi:hypothetical protein
MVKIKINRNIEKKFKENILDIFKNNRLIKKENKKIKFDISINDINNLLKKKLGKFDKNISLELLILANIEYLYSLVEYINNNKYITQLSNIEKEYFFTLYSRLKKAEFIQSLDIKACPYCNRNYIFNFAKNSSQNATAQLDHFFDKSTYPYLAISLYNLVPSCSTCNQRKSNKNIKLIHPYQESLDDLIKFELKINSVDFYYKENAFEIEPIVINDIDNISKNNIETFNLKQLYNNHKDIIVEILKRKEIYPDSRIDELYKEFGGKLFNSKDELIGLIHCNYIDKKDINKRPLSKLTKDILEQI